jgi:hypothetical protein
MAHLWHTGNRLYRLRQRRHFAAHGTGGGGSKDATHLFRVRGHPHGRDKIERSFSAIAQVILSPLPGFAPDGERPPAVLTLPQLAAELEDFLVDKYLITPHSATDIAPQERWGGRRLSALPNS